MRGSELNLRHLRAFSAVAKHASISMASSEVFLSQPAISQAIAKLETALQSPLFERHSNGMHATEPGRLFANRVDRALSHIETGARLAAQASPKAKKGFAKFHQLLTTAQLRALLAVADAGNFSLAARSAQISQPTLHRSARDLERLSGMVLFNKTGLGINLSRSAQILAQYARLTFSELDQGVDEVQSWSGQDRGRMAIGTMPLARTYILPKAIREFSKIHPEINVSVIDGPFADLLHGLRYGELDCLIGALRDPLPIDDIKQKILFHDRLAIVAGPNHPLVGATNVTVDQLGQYPWVVPRRETPTRNFFDNLFTKNELEIPSHIIESSSLLLIRGLLEDNERLTIISSHQIMYEEKRGNLVPLDFDTSNTSRPIGLTTRKNWQPTTAQSMMLDLIMSACHEIDAE